MPWKPTCTYPRCHRESGIQSIKKAQCIMTMTLSNYFKSCCRKTNHGVSRKTLYCLPNKHERKNNIKPWQHVATWMRSHFKALSWCTSRVIHSSSCELTQHVPFKASWEDEFPFHRWDMLAAWSIFQRIGCVPLNQLFSKLHPFHTSSLGKPESWGHSHDQPSFARKLPSACWGLPKASTWGTCRRHGCKQGP